MQRTMWIEYELRLSDGSLLESNTISFVPGRDQILPALERRIRGLKAGQEIRGQLRACEAFGDVDLLPVTELDRREFPARARLEPGRRFEAATTGGDRVRVEGVEVGETIVKVRFLHALAEEDVSFRVKVLAVEGVPPPLPAGALGIDSAAIQLVENSGAIRVGTDERALN